MKIVAASDLHLDSTCRAAFLRQAETADLAILAGDLAQRRQGLTDFVEPFEAIAGKLVMVAGNNESLDELRAATSATVLHGETANRDGVAVAGIGGAIPPIHVPTFQSYNIEEDAAEALLDQIHEADILISHSPPHGIGDVFDGHISMGSAAVRRAAERLRPKLLLCGHVHDCWGTRDMLGETRVANLGPVPVIFEI